MSDSDRIIPYGYRCIVLRRGVRKPQKPQPRGSRHADSAKRERLAGILPAVSQSDTKTPNRLQRSLSASVDLQVGSDRIGHGQCPFQLPVTNHQVAV